MSTSAAGGIHRRTAVRRRRVLAAATEGGEGDPEIGNTQAGALSGGYPSFLGRDNANQITLQDGIPGITNQYLFQPLPGAFYFPCTDGDYDMSIIAHECNHAISNRMVGGPDAGLTSHQGGAMGESWGDQIGVEYQFEHGYTTGTDPAVVGPYLASASSGATVAASPANSLTAGSLIDDTEATNWAGVNPTGVSVDTVNPYVTVDLAGGQSLVRSVRVSAMLRPVQDENDADQESGSRFTALRKFAIEVCVQSASVDCAGTTPTPGAYQRIYTSPDDAFPGSRPRPLAPQLIFNTFDVPDSPATHVRLVALENWRSSASTAPSARR